ncbi:hypothetical protein KY290_008900 [Solanum tuberosum]|uniref:Uncharacterized protein n=1 Tax=Solanum tuberosum TaxID=4113 RepID=A0ABQ7W9W5_SOLTU|nr:hypothetical protein KY289_009302 [Solanum tuberosum]KAH0715952.1 hypothetical protein KY284_008857 [Solanum tuberosum]KAH0747201.1 hypothetical protein KY285_008858 [Solanum tuberosum]KAH0777489.1 hypothetical protein KY290_008900 [Solanum tuberosum]
MSNSSSLSRFPLSQGIETPSLFNFSIPPPEESPSTPVSGVVLFGKESQNSEVQSIVKTTLQKPFEDLEVVSKAVPSTMSERLFEGDLPEGKGTESIILAAAEELVAVQSLASLRGNIQPTLLE